MDNRSIFLTENDISLYEGWIVTDADIQMEVNYKKEDFVVIYDKQKKTWYIHGKLSKDDKSHIINTLKHLVRKKKVVEIFR